VVSSFLLQRYDVFNLPVMRVIKDLFPSTKHDNTGLHCVLNLADTTYPYSHSKKVGGFQLRSYKNLRGASGGGSGEKIHGKTNM
jgi:hypothetical protein